MNIFYLDEDPVEISEMLCDKHSVKMVLESSQMLSTAHRILDGNEYANEWGLYRVAHKNHPSTVWTRASDKNYMWHLGLLRAMLDEYTFRFGKVHKCSELYHALIRLPQNIVSGQFVAPPQCMPNEYKCSDTVRAYRQYYVGEKAHFAKWNSREVPHWFTDNNAA